MNTTTTATEYAATRAAGFLPAVTALDRLDRIDASDKFLADLLAA